VTDDDDYDGDSDDEETGTSHEDQYTYDNISLNSS
jgi:hypothetical protein